MALEYGRCEILFYYWLANKRITTYHKRPSGFVYVKIHNICVAASGNGAGEVRDAGRAG
jgi:hypothetical protein